MTARTTAVGHQRLVKTMPSLLLVTTISATLRSFLLPISEGLRRKGWRVDAAANGVSSDCECLRAFDRVFEVRWSRNPLDLVAAFRSCKRFRALVARQQYDIVHVHTPIASFLARLAMRATRRKYGFPKVVVYTAHGFTFIQQVVGWETPSSANSRGSLRGGLTI